MTGVMTRRREIASPVAGDRFPTRPSPLPGRVIGDAERVGRVTLQAVSGDDLLRLWEEAVGQVQGLVPVLAHTVDELARHVQDKRTAEPLFTQVDDPGPNQPEG
jgi:hypothetical protein